MPRAYSPELRVCLDALRRDGLLLEAGATLPSVASLVAGEPVRGSWWAHPRSHEIYEVCQALRRRPDTLLVKLVSRKDTYVHRPLWSALIAVATSREPWQVARLPALARSLLALVDAQGDVMTNDVPLLTQARAKDIGDAARELERRLLAQGEHVHTATGAHAIRLQTWRRWASHAAAGIETMRPRAAKAALEAALARMNNDAGAKSKLPWQ